MLTISFIILTSVLLPLVTCGCQNEVLLANSLDRGIVGLYGFEFKFDGRYIATGNSLDDDDDNRPIYKHETEDLVLFWSGHWKFETLSVLNDPPASRRNSLGFFFAPGSTEQCPGMVAHGGWEDYYYNAYADDPIVVAECPQEGSDKYYWFYLFNSLLSGKLIRTIGNQKGIMQYYQVFMSSFASTSSKSPSASRTSCALECRYITTK